MRVVVVGLGVQGKKRTAVAGKDVVAIVDPSVVGASHKNIGDIPLADYDAALLCTPDGVKIDLLTYLLGNGKHALVEKPLLDETGDDEIAKLRDLAPSIRPYATRPITTVSSRISSGCTT